MDKTKLPSYLRLLHKLWFNYGQVLYVYDILVHVSNTIQSTTILVHIKMQHLKIKSNANTHIVGGCLSKMRMQIDVESSITL